jgi:hypothetical protein
LGTLSFVVGFVFTAKIFWDKIEALYISKIPIKRAITDQPLFYLALVALVIGVQLFVTGFLAEMIAMQSLSNRTYLVIENVGLESEQSKLQVVGK